MPFVMIAATGCSGRARVEVRVPIVRSGMAGDALAVSRLEGVVVRVTSRDVGRDVERRDLTRVPEPLRRAEGEELGDVRGRDRGDRAGGQSVTESDRGVA